MPSCQSETRWRAIVEHIDRIAIEPDDFRQPLDDPCDIVECVSERAAIRHIGLSEPGKIWRDDVKPIREFRDEVAEHMAGARETVQQQDRRCVFRSRLAMEDFEPVDVDLPETDLQHWDLFSSLFITICNLECLVNPSCHDPSGSWSPLLMHVTTIGRCVAAKSAARSGMPVG